MIKKIITELLERLFPGCQEIHLYVGNDFGENKNEKRLVAFLDNSDDYTISKEAGHCGGTHLEVTVPIIGEEEETYEERVDACKQLLLKGIDLYAEIHK